MKKQTASQRVARLRNWERYELKNAMSHIRGSHLIKTYDKQIIISLLKNCLINDEIGYKNFDANKYYDGVALENKTDDEILNDYKWYCIVNNSNKFEKSNGLYIQQIGRCKRKITLKKKIVNKIKHLFRKK